MKYVFIFFFLFSVNLSAQHLFDFENDSSGVVESCLHGWCKQIPPGRWESSQEGAISGKFSLHHSYDNTEAGCDFFLIPHDPLEVQDSLSISFRIRHGYPPSSANNWQVAILSDLETEGDNGGKISGGLILGVNYNGSDDLVKLWKCQDDGIDLICNTSLNYQEEIGSGLAPLFTIIWSTGGDLDLYYSPDPPSAPTELIGSCRLDALPEGRNLLVRYEYTSARDRGLWLDDIRLEGNFVTDSIAPEIRTVEVLDKRSIQIWFSEHVLLPGTSSFFLLGAEGSDSSPQTGQVVPDSVFSLDNRLVISFPGVIPNREEQILRVTGICDADGNCLSDTVVRFMRNDAVWGDVVFTEVMFDPEPVVGLPAQEYLEIWNRSGFVLDLEDWYVSVNDRNQVISAMELEHGQYGLCYNLTLPNDGATLGLFSENGTLVHGARYAIPWDEPGWKKEGGWSLESPDPELVCNVTRLWTYSTDRNGGTPGRVNSNDAILEDRDPPVYLYYGIRDTGILQLWFSEPVLASPGLVTLNPGGVFPDSIVPGIPVSDHLNLHFRANLMDRTSFELELKSVNDCAGNQSHQSKFLAGNSANPRFGSLLINEIMYDPPDWAPGYIELFNPGNRYFDLQNMSLDIVKLNAMPDHPIPLTGHSRILGPGEYAVISRDIRHLMDAYELDVSGCWLETKHLPGFPGSEGTIYLTERSGNLVDRAHYGNRMHLELLDDTKGISLERINTDRPGTDPGN
ncbi:MAG: lamin tail domain-containing protein, partial [Bacteroidales bacterium]|nr:lamin tail domain-containing protein [Bacteroidales bacterium]